MPTLAELRRTYREKALELGTPPRDVDLLLADLVGKSIAWMIAHDETVLSDADAGAFHTRMERRFAGEPVQYIRTRTEFYGREFHVDSRVLIPRPETELLVEAALERADGRRSVVDIGAGTGCVSITLSLEAPWLDVAAVDRSVAALAVARMNQGRLGSRVRFFASDLLASTRRRFDLIVSNPPYIAKGDIDTLQREVRDYEPHLALESGAEGLDAIVRILGDARRCLASDGVLLFEIGFGQSDRVAGIAAEAGWRVEAILNDLAAIPRVVVLSRL
jgi:release factor glutamine methyltransferase